MTPLNELANRLSVSLPTARIDYSEPATAGGVGFLDIVLNGNTISVLWQEMKHFGISSPEGHGFGEASDEVYQTVNATVSRITDLLTSGKKTRPPLHVQLRELRAERNITQKDLAALLGVSQPAISGFESRVDRMNISTLRTVIQAMGGNLILQARFPDGVIREIATEELDADDLSAPELAASKN